MSYICKQRFWYNRWFFFLFYFIFDNDATCDMLARYLNVRRVRYIRMHSETGENYIKNVTIYIFACVHNGPVPAVLLLGQSCVKKYKRWKYTKTTVHEIDKLFFLSETGFWRAMHTIYAVRQATHHNTIFGSYNTMLQKPHARCWSAGAAAVRSTIQFHTIRTQKLYIIS